MRDRVDRRATPVVCTYDVVRATLTDATRYREQLQGELQGPIDAPLCTPTNTCFGSELCIYNLPRMDVTKFISPSRRFYLCHDRRKRRDDDAPLGCLVVSEFADVMQLSHAMPYRFAYTDVPTCRRIYLISSVCVAKTLRGTRGVGRAMMEGVVRDLHRSDPDAEIMLTVRPYRALDELPPGRRDAQHEINQRADGLLRFYKARGFDVIDRDAHMWLMRRRRTCAALVDGDTGGWGAVR